MPWVSRAAVAFALHVFPLQFPFSRALQFFFSSPSCTRVGLGITEAVPVTWQPSCDTELPPLHPCKQSSFVGFPATASSVPWPCTWSSAPDTTGACTDSPLHLQGLPPHRNHASFCTLVAARWQQAAMGPGDLPKDAGCDFVLVSPSCFLGKL